MGRVQTFGGFRDGPHGPCAKLIRLILTITFGLNYPSMTTRAPIMMARSTFLEPMCDRPESSTGGARRSRLIRPISRKLQGRTRVGSSCSSMSASVECRESSGMHMTYCRRGAPGGPVLVPSFRGGTQGDVEESKSRRRCRFRSQSCNDY
jgi:hypothetical protein